MSRRFHNLVTTPHAWRSAFSRFFPGPDSLNATDDEEEDEYDDTLRTERRAFARVTALASWRSEYILRTRLLRSLARGKPVQAIASPTAARTGQCHTSTSVVMYNSQLFTTINHLHATFGSGLNKRVPRFIHGADDVGAASSSDPSAGKVDPWGLTDPTVLVQFADRYPGDAQYGLGSGEIVGAPNVMDVSQPYGMVYGEGTPDGMVYYRFVEEMRGRFLAASSGLSALELGIPKVLSTREAVTSVWIAKSSNIPSLTDGLIGIVSGSSLGVVTTYSLGPLGARDQKFTRGEMTARWVLSPGVPIIAIAVDEQYSLKRQAQNRIWAVALNALGEIHYLTRFPKRVPPGAGTRFDDEAREKSPWLTGRSVYWTLAEPSRRIARPNPYSGASVDGSYSPRTSWDGMCLSKEQIKAETHEIEDYLGRKPKDFQRSCLGWDMRRRLEVDFTGDDGNGAGETVVVFDCGLEEDGVASITRFMRCKSADPFATPKVDDLPSLTSSSNIPTATSSLFGGPVSSAIPSPNLAPTPKVEFSLSDMGGDLVHQQSSEEWRSSTFSLGGLKSVEIITTALDCSTFATLTASEDPLLTMSGASSTSSPSLTPLSQGEIAASPADIPGQRARFVAAGTKLGSVLLWNMRSPPPTSTSITNTIEPVRIIHTDSPQISCLALSSLYLVHGGNDGLVQAWDPLASSTSPIRTLNSRFSSRARRRLVQAQASPQGVGINLFAAGAICLDPDPTVLRGMVSLGTHLRYWSYSSSAADQYKSHKRRLRRSERGSNYAGERALAGVARGNLKDYIASEKFEMDLEAERQEKEAVHLAGRFGTELLGDDATEEEIMAYAALLSQEALEREQKRRESDTTAAIQASLAGSDSSVLGSNTGMTTPQDIPSPQQSSSNVEEEVDPDIAEAIRLSLEAEQDQSFEADNSSWDIPIRYAKGRNGSTPKASPPQYGGAEGSNAKELTDLEFAIQLSMAEEESRKAAEAEAGDAFPALSPGEGNAEGGRSKGKGRMW